jgi:hypothetical protein
MNMAPFWMASRFAMTGINISVAQYNADLVSCRDSMRTLSMTSINDTTICLHEARVEASESTSMKDMCK